eukprot:4737758-Pyramimonas_sp.AAC.1
MCIRDSVKLHIAGNEVSLHALAHMLRDKRALFCRGHRPRWSRTSKRTHAERVHAVWVLQLAPAQLRLSR